MADVTQLLSRIEQGDAGAAEQLLPLVYTELRRAAAGKLARENPGQTLQATALVHEAYLRLIDVKQASQWNSRGHFFVAAAEAMRRILVESARRKRSIKRGGGRPPLDLDRFDVPDTTPPVDVVELDEALHKLSELDPEAADLIKLRFFAGMSMGEAARMLNVSERKAHYLWAYARSWQTGL
jgi:RNA polymerase sigma factor (TIGR02999 family)